MISLSTEVTRALVIISRCSTRSLASGRPEHSVSAGLCDLAAVHAAEQIQVEYSHMKAWIGNSQIRPLSVLLRNDENCAGRSSIHCRSKNPSSCSSPQVSQISRSRVSISELRTTTKDVSYVIRGDARWPPLSRPARQFRSPSASSVSLAISRRCDQKGDQWPTNVYRPPRLVLTQKLWSSSSSTPFSSSLSAPCERPMLPDP